MFTTPLIPGNSATVNVTASVTGYLNAWIDYNANNDWSDAGEQIFTDLLISGGLNTLNFNVPASATIGTTFARFRFSTITGIGFDGQAQDGEVEDYEVEIEEETEECKMHFPQWPDLETTGVDVYDMQPKMLADDFLCTETGAITDIRIWGSWRNDEVDQPEFHLSIWSDNPQGPGGYSQPDSLLWSMHFVPGQYEDSLYAVTEEGEWWYNPNTEELIFPGDYQVWQYVFSIPEDSVFIQEDSTVYWLSVQAYGQPTEQFEFGWKTSQYHWNDDAVWTDMYMPGWNELIYPFGHPLHPQSMDLAFIINGNPVDFGDAPDVFYQTLLASDGARHIIDNLTYLGTSIDGEIDGLPHTSALGDDFDNLDDEDGVIFTTNLEPGNSATVEVTASVSGYLNAWMDFNINGTWADAGEQIFTDVLLLPGLNTLNFNVPAGATLGNTFARFRFSTVGGLDYFGIAEDGEVEDYKVFIIEPGETKMHYPQDPKTGGWDVEFAMSQLADDFLCTETGYITSIDFWISWMQNIDYSMYIDSITVSIYSDMPEYLSPYRYSIPDTLLWTGTFGRDEFSIIDMPPDLQGWYDPSSGQWALNDHDIWDKIEISKIYDAFYQEEGNIYWLVIDFGELPYVGWKESGSPHFNDDGVWWSQADSMWFELRDPITYESLDLAFALYCNPLPITDLTITVVSDTVILNWTGVPCADYYRIYSSTDPYATFPSGWTVEATIPASSTSWSESATVTKKFYRVTAGN